MNNYEICTRAVIEKNGKILVCQFKGHDFYFLPGGHVEFFEKAKDALERELKEELDMEVESMEYIGTVENMYESENLKHHEINLIFKVDALGEVKDKSMEDELDFFFLDKDHFAEANFLPVALKNSMVEWFKDRNTFWASQS